MFFPVCLGQRQQHAPEAGPALGIVRREVCAAVKRLAFGSKKRRERPATLTADGLDRGLITAVHVRTLVAVHFDGDEMFIDDGGDLRRFIRFAVHHMAPVAPHRANVQQDRFIFLLGFFKSVRPPLLPLHRLVHG